MIPKNSIAETQQNEVEHTEVNYLSKIPMQDVFTHKTVANIAAVNGIIGAKIGYVGGYLYAPKLAVKARDITQNLVKEISEEMLDKYIPWVPEIIRGMVFSSQIDRLANTSGEKAYSEVDKNLPQQAAIWGYAAASGLTIIGMEACNLLVWGYNNIMKDRQMANLQALADNANKAAKELAEFADETEDYGFHKI